MTHARIYSTLLHTFHCVISNIPSHTRVNSTFFYPHTFILSDIPLHTHVNSTFFCPHTCIVSNILLHTHVFIVSHTCIVSNILSHAHESKIHDNKPYVMLMRVFPQNYLCTSTYLHVLRRSVYHAYLIHPEIYVHTHVFSVNYDMMSCTCWYTHPLENILVASSLCNSFRCKHFLNASLCNLLRYFSNCKYSLVWY